MRLARDGSDPHSMPSTDPELCAPHRVSTASPAWTRAWRLHVPPRRLHALSPGFEQIVHIGVGARCPQRRDGTRACTPQPRHAPDRLATRTTGDLAPSRARARALEQRPYADDPATRAAGTDLRFEAQFHDGIRRPLGRRSVPRRHRRPSHTLRSSAQRSTHEDSTGHRSGPAKSRRRSFVASDSPRVVCAAWLVRASHARSGPARFVSGR